MPTPTSPPPPKKNFYLLLICINLYQYTKNQLIPSAQSSNLVHQAHPNISWSIFNLCQFASTCKKSGYRAYSGKLEHANDFSEKGQKKVKKEQNIWKFGQKRTKFENILKKGNLMHATIACMKQLEYPLGYFNCLFWRHGWLKNPAIWLAENILAHISRTKIFPNMRFV